MAKNKKIDTSNSSSLCREVVESDHTKFSKVITDKIRLVNKFYNIDLDKETKDFAAMAKAGDVLESFSHYSGTYVKSWGFFLTRDGQPIHKHTIGVNPE
jgi:hypothetical protein